MAQASLCRLDVHSRGDEGGGVGPAKVMEPGAALAGGCDRGQPDAVAPVRVVQRATPWGGEDQLVGVSAGATERIEVRPL